MIDSTVIWTIICCISSMSYLLGNSLLCLLRVPPRTYPHARDGDCPRTWIETAESGLVVFLLFTVSQLTQLLQNGPSFLLGCDFQHFSTYIFTSNADSSPLLLYKQTQQAEHSTLTNTHPNHPTCLHQNQPPLSSPSPARSETASTAISLTKSPYEPSKN